MLKTVMKICLALMILSSVSMAKKEALLVVVSDYGDGDGKAGTKKDLKGLNHDLAKMKALLKCWKFKVQVVENAESMYLGNRLDEYASFLKESDDFILYFSGHGSQTADKNGDETDDHLDETLVLSDGRVNKHFLDDDLYGYLNAIKARKMLILDACHSATAFKAFGDKPVAKSISAKSIDGVIETKKFSAKESRLSKKEDYIVFSASQDNEKSLADSRGSFFTTAFVEQFNNGAMDEKLDVLQDEINSNISEHCRKTNSKVHRANLSVSNSFFKHTTVHNYFHNDEIQRIIDKKGVSVISKKRFRDREEFSFKLNSRRKRGYWSIFAIEKGQVEMLFQSVKKYGGKLTYPTSFNAESLECELRCTNNCSEEKSTIYLLLTDEVVEVRGVANPKNHAYPFEVRSHGSVLTNYVKQKFDIVVYEYAEER